MNIGRVCVKIAGREAGSIAVIVDHVDDTFVLIDGVVKRRKCNKNHLEPTSKIIEIKPKAEKKEVLDKLVAAGLLPDALAKKASEKKSKTPGEKPVAKRAMKTAEKKVKKKTAPKKAEPKAEKKEAAPKKSAPKKKAPAKKAAKPAKK